MIHRNSFFFTFLMSKPHSKFLIGIRFTCNKISSEYLYEYSCTISKMLHWSITSQLPNQKFSTLNNIQHFLITRTTKFNSTKNIQSILVNNCLKNKYTTFRYKEIRNKVYIVYRTYVHSSWVTLETFSLIENMNLVENLKLHQSEILFSI